MRPERFRYEMNLAFDEWFKTRSTKRFHSLMREMERVWKKLSKQENDYRTGEETYGYSDVETIEYNMLYISYRYLCAFRLKWIIDGIKNKKI